MSQFSYVPGDSRLVEHIIGELKSKGIFDQFRKECISDVDTKPAYQNLRLRVEGSVSNFLSRQRWKPDLNKNQLREKLRKHIHEANYLEQGVERIVDQVVNPKVASVFIPQVEDLVYSVLGIQKPKSSQNSHSPKNEIPCDEGSTADMGAVSFENHDNEMVVLKDNKPEYIEMEVDEPATQLKPEKEEAVVFEIVENSLDIPIPFPDGALQDSSDSRKANADKQLEFKEELVVTTELSNLSIDIPLPEDPPKRVREESSESKQTDTETSLDSVIMRNVSPLTPIRSFNNENSCDAQPAFDEIKGVSESSSSEKVAETTIPISNFRFTIEKDCEELNLKANKKVNVETPISYPYGQSSINNYSAPTYDDSSSSNNLHIDYQSDKDGATTFDGKNEDTKQEAITTLALHDDQSKSKDTNYDDKKKSHKSSHSSKDSNRHSSSSRHGKDRKSDSKYSSGDKKDSSKGDKKSSKDDTSHGKSRHSSHREKSKERNNQDKSKERNDRDKKESGDKKDKEKGDSSKDRHSSHKTSSSNNSKSSKHSSSSSRHHSSSNTKHTDEKKPSSSKSDDKKSDKDKEHRHSSKSSRDHSRHSSSHRSDKDKHKSSSSKDKDIKKDDKKEKKITDDHYSASGRGNRTRRSTDRDSNDGNSSSSKGSTLISNVKTANTTADNKSSTSKSDNQSNGSDTTSQSDAVENVECHKEVKNKIIGIDDKNKSLKPVLKLDSKLKTPVVESSQLPQVPELPVKKPMIAANMNEVLKLMKIRKQLAAEQEKKRQEAALLIEFQQKIHSSISQVYSGISGPELEFACFEKDPTDDKFNVKLQNTYNTEKQHQELNNIEEVKVISDLKTLQNCQKGNGTITKSKTDNTDDIDAEDDYLNFVYGDPNKEFELHYFSQRETCSAKIECDKFSKFLESLEKVDPAKTIFLLNCDFHHELVLQKLCQEIEGDCKIVNFNQAKPKTHPSKLNTQDVVKSELSLPALVNINASVEESDFDSNSSIFSSNESAEYSFDANIDYEKKIDDIMQAKCYGRQEVMEIILGGLATDFVMMTPSMENNTEEDELKRVDLKRKHNGLIEEDRIDNNNHKVLMPNKLRRHSLSETISSTTEDESISSTPTNNLKSKFIGKVRRVGLPKPKNNKVSISPLSDQSVENYIQNIQTDKTSPKLNGTISIASKPKKNKLTQRYDTSDLYKPKLHYLSKRHSQVN